MQLTVWLASMIILLASEGTQIATNRTPFPNKAACEELNVLALKEFKARPDQWADVIAYGFVCSEVPVHEVQRTAPEKPALRPFDPSKGDRES